MNRHRYRPSFLREGQSRDVRLRCLAVESLCHAFPAGAMVLDARGGFLFSNREGAELLSRWNEARPKTGVHSMRRRPNVPPEIVAACNGLRQGGANDGSPRARPNFGGRVLVRHAKNQNLSAVVALERSSRDRRVAVFCILLQDRLKDNLVAGRRDQLALLTIAERRVAKLVADGLRNSDIAEALGKSITTVKSQLGTIFSKLDLRSRTQLAALLRSV